MRRTRRTTGAALASPRALGALAVALALSWWHHRLLRSLSRSGGPSASGADVGIVAEGRRRSDLTFGVLTHLGTVFPAEDILENQIDSLTRGWDGSVFDQVYVYYDDIRMDEERWRSFSERLRELKSAGRVTDLIPLNRSEAVPELMGNGRYIKSDAMLWATHQFLVQDCRTEYCALFTHDILAYGGGGLRHATLLLEREPRFVFAIPPRANNRATWDARDSESLRRIYEQPGTFERPHLEAVGVIAAGEPSASAGCARGVPRHGPAMSTRHFVAHRGRFLSRLPFRPRPKKAAYLEAHPGVNGVTAVLDCERGTGLLFHPPPWQAGEALFRSCGDIATLQRAVDSPDGLAVGKFNNMIRESWTEACREGAGAAPSSAGHLKP